LGIFLQDALLQIQIINFGQKIAASWGGNFPLDNPFACEYWSIVVVFISPHSLVNPATKPLTFRRES
jgi:hypothetical protein